MKVGKPKKKKIVLVSRTQTVKLSLWKVFTLEVISEHSHVLSDLKILFFLYMYVDERHKPHTNGYVCQSK